MLLLFDIDGTLLLKASREHAEAVVAAIRRVYDLHSVPDGKVEAAGRTDLAIARSILTLAGVDDERITRGFERLRAAIVEEYAQRCPPSLADRVAPGVHEMLDTLDGGHRLALLTGNIEPVALLKMRRAGLGDYFERGRGAYGSDHEDRAALPALARKRSGTDHRPHPRADTVVIGDTPRDIACARADGVRVIAVATGPFAASELGDADAVVPRGRDPRGAGYARLMHLRSSAPELAEAWAAFDRGAAEEAIAHFDALPGNPDALYGIAQSRWFLGDIDAGVRLAEEAYVAFREAGEGARAADVALWLAIEYVNSYWNPAVANGWFRRGERLLADCAPCAATVELGVQRARRAGSPEETVRIFEEALALARELGDIGSELRALSAFGGYKVGAGDDEEGFALLDEAMAAAMGGETRDPWAIGSACCALLGVCDQMVGLDRAAQWCRTGLNVVRRERCLPLFAWCRSAYAGVLIATGDWERAEKELQESLRAYGGPGRPMATYPLARLASSCARAPRGGGGAGRGDREQRAGGACGDRDPARAGRLLPRALRLGRGWKRRPRVTPGRSRCCRCSRERS